MKYLMSHVQFEHIIPLTHTNGYTSNYTHTVVHLHMQKNGQEMTQPDHLFYKTQFIMSVPLFCVTPNNKQTLKSHCT